MATIENFATVSYTSGGVAVTRTSNLAEIELNSSLSFTKETLGDTYTVGTPVTYVLSLTNDATTPITGISVADDLGTFTLDTQELTPLAFQAPALLLINGQDNTASLTVTATDTSVTFSFPTLAAGATANIIYNATPNEFAPPAQGSFITNTAELTSDSECASGSATATVTAAEAAEIEVIKSMSPNPVVCGETVTYTIRIFNYGNIAAEDVVLTDTFTPAPTDITVFRNGIELVGTGYTYIDGTLTVPATNGDTVPAATFTRDAQTGIVTTTPGVVEYVITGTI
ncbi:MAG: DUF11 domain-containing protein [Ruminococcaceae bacterium]|nr:DUF11 domain-containing protein [Oscillospiraceae bacterium]